MNRIQIQWDGDHGCHNQNDTDRARRAAQAVLDAAGVTDYSALFLQVVAAIEGDGDVPEIWSAAEAAAQAAGTEGWVNPQDVIVTISA